MKIVLVFVMVMLAAGCQSGPDTRLHATEPGTQQRSGAIQVDLRTDEAVYRRGEPIQISVSASQRSRLEIWSEDATGRRTPVWPRAGQGAAVISAGHTLRLPATGADWRLLAAEPVGVNTLVAIAKSAPSMVSVPFEQTPPYFEMGTGGWKGERGLAVTSADKPPAVSSAARRPQGEARWLYEVK